jgi:uncharacterized protein YecE (DUF72 family)
MGPDRELVDYSRIQVDRSREIEAWANALSRARNVYGYFNNHFAGHSPASARAMQQALGLRSVDPEQLGEQMSLF